MNEDYVRRTLTAGSIPIGNYYGTPMFYQTEDGSCWLELEDHSSVNRVKISQHLYYALYNEEWEA